MAGKKWCAAALLCVALLAGLNGCSRESGPPAGEPEASAAESLPPLPALPPLSAAEAYPVGRFADPAVEEAVRSTCGRPEGTLTQDHLDQVERLVINGVGLESLSGLQSCRALRELQLPSNGLTDCTPLQTLTRLEHLDLSGNPGLDLAPLQTLTGLRQLELSGCALTDLSALQTLTGLEYLGLEDNEITDLTPLQTLTGLDRLALMGNPLTPEALWVLGELKPGAVELLRPEAD